MDNIKIKHTRKTVEQLNPKVVAILWYKIKATYALIHPENREVILNMPLQVSIKVVSRVSLRSYGQYIHKSKHVFLNDYHIKKDNVNTFGILCHELVHYLQYSLDSTYPARYINFDGRKQNFYAYYTQEIESDANIITWLLHFPINKTSGKWYYLKSAYFELAQKVYNYKIVTR